MSLSNLALALLKPVAYKLTRPLAKEVRTEIHRLLVAVSLSAAGIACLIVGLSYFASSLWHALVPILGTVGADFLLGTLYALLAGILLFFGLREIR
jgi:polyferredoxin